MVFTATAAKTAARVASASASVVFTATAGRTSAFAHSAAGSVVFTATAAHSSAYSASASASAVFTATASSGVPHAGVATASVVFTATAARVAANAYPVHSRASVVFRVRCRGKRPGATFADGYLGRYQLGQDVPLVVQCVDSNGTPAVPDSFPIALVCREGVYLRTVGIPAETDPDVTGRFRGRYTLGDGDAPGHYAVVYLYSTLGLRRGESDQFEVVPGGDASGPVLAGYSLSRPDGDYFLAHLAAGRMASGQTPYLDEGI